MKLQPIFVNSLPSLDDIKTGQIWISHKHRTINLRCPYGCGALTVLTIHPSRWHVHFDGKTVSLTGPTGGSVWARTACGCHYCIRNNEVIRMKAIDPSHHEEYAKAEQNRMREHTIDKQAPTLFSSNKHHKFTDWITGFFKK